ncbi:hypothetical protein LJK88_07385 [Paenibacillus sp. P26]|nr:hypothetical protein LJK88_07385 [Paenibacillus sp. P26]
MDGAFRSGRLRHDHPRHSYRRRICRTVPAARRHAGAADQIRQSLDKHQDYFTYLSAHIDQEGPLMPPPGKLSPAEQSAIQSKSLEWIETIGGEHRDKLTALCRDMGLVELERKRLRSPRRGTRIEAAYRLGIMRASECTEDLLKLLEQEGAESTAFVVGRAAAKCAGSLEELHRLLILLTRQAPGGPSIDCRYSRFLVAGHGNAPH